MAQALFKANRGGHHPSGDARKASFVVKPGAEAACFDLALGRFVELNGRTMADPSHPCVVEAHAQARAEVKVVSLWSRKAVNQFGEFWPRYARAYGTKPAWDQLAPSTAKRRGKSDGRSGAPAMAKKPSLAV